MKGKNFIALTLLIWTFLFFITLPFPLYSFTHPGFYTEAFFVWIERGIYSLIFSKETGSSMLSSDSDLLYVHLLFTVFCSFCLAALWRFFFRKEINYRAYLALISAYLLAFFLMKYGFDKVFKHQFYSPEPNILHTPLGYLSKDILFWSTMGSSYSYSLFCGIIEVIPALLLLHPRTRKAGAVIAFGVMLQVFVINLSFDITVKILSGTLLALSLFSLSPYFKELYRYFFSQETTMTLKQGYAYQSDSLRKRIIKFVMVFFILFESLFHAFSSGNFNDDLEKRPPFHGAYEVIHVPTEQDQSPIGNLKKIKRIFIHRQGYLITQTADDRFKDYPLFSFGIDHCMILRDREKTGLCFTKLPNNCFKLRIETPSKRCELELRIIDLQRMPLNQ